jgi:hypothetical protein
MKNIKKIILLLILSLTITNCSINRYACNPKKPLFKYKSTVHGYGTWNYKKYQTPKRKLIK